MSQRRQLTTDEARGVDEDAAIDASEGVESAVADPAPCLWERLATLERLGVLRNGLDAPLAVGLGALGVEDVERELVRGDLQLALENVEVLLGLAGTREESAVGSKKKQGLWQRRARMLFRETVR